MSNDEIMDRINRFLAFPAVDQQDRFRIVQRLVILIPRVSGFRPDRGHSTARGHLLGKLPGIAVFAGITQIHGDRHDG